MLSAGIIQKLFNRWLPNNPDTAKSPAAEVAEELDIFQLGLAFFLLGTAAALAVILCLLEVVASRKLDKTNKTAGNLVRPVDCSSRIWM